MTLRLELCLGDRSGTTLAEFAMLMPLFFVLVIGIVQVGQMLWTQAALQHAVEMAARCATVNATSCGTSANIQSFATTQAYGMSFPNSVFSASTPSCGNEVSASYTYVFQTAVLPLTQVVLTAQSCFPK